MAPDWLTAAQKDSAGYIVVETTMTLLGVDPNAQAAEPSYRKKMLGGNVEMALPVSTRTTGTVVFTAEIRTDGTYRMTTGGRKTSWLPARNASDWRPLEDDEDDDEMSRVLKEWDS
jgi:hypothetical protein